MPGATLDVFQIKRGDTLPAIRRTLKFSDGTVQDLKTSTSIDFVYAPKDGELPDFVNAVTRTATIVNAPGTDGIVEYAWIAADTADTGEFFAEFQVHFGANKLTFPNADKQYILMKVTRDVDDA